MSTSQSPHKTRIITVSGRIASGSTTLAKRLAAHFGWKHIEGGEIFWEAIRKKTGYAEKDTNLRKDEEDQAFDDELKRMLTEDSGIVLETKLAGFNAQGIDGIFKVLVLVTDENGEDHTDIRIDRLVNREHITVEAAKEEVIYREQSDIERWRRMYAPNDPNWTYWDPKYYDLVVNTYSHDQDEALAKVIASIEEKAHKGNE